MAEHPTLVMGRILETYEGFKDLEELVDVGGGVGSTLNLIVSKYPRLVVVLAVDSILPVAAETSSYAKQTFHVDLCMLTFNPVEKERTEEFKYLAKETGFAGATHENGDIETLAYRNDVNNCSCPKVNLVINENGFDSTFAPDLQERSNWLPELNLGPNLDDGLYVGEIYVKKYEDDVISQINISEEPIHKSSLNTTSHNLGQPNAEAETKQIEGQFRDLQEPRSCCEYDYNANTLLEDGPMTESPISIGSSSDVDGLENVDAMLALEENLWLEFQSSWEHILLVDGTMIQSPTKIGFPIDVHDLENVDGGHILVGKNPCLESDSTWEHIDFNEEDHI
ncbi:hypothetical protein SUGI_1183460 [Cryptomeria japonica]|nr:hypothetical protein SUGI_1183460 [Cryptomeria japonica]